jgi:hypothetical protein
MEGARRRKGVVMVDEPVEVLWALGEAPWRDLRPDIAAAGRVTAVSAHSVHLLDVDRGVAVRVPGPWGNDLDAGAIVERPLLSVIVATPCGLLLLLDDVGRRCSTPLVLLFGGWLGAEAVTGQVAALLRRHGAAVPTAAGHPDVPCGAFYCVAREGGS